MQAVILIGSTVQATIAKHGDEICDSLSNNNLKEIIFHDLLI
jgi:hypothetical protein